jgi:hypothetical protein
MKPAFLIFVVAALLVGSSSAEAARGTAAGNSNLILPATPPISSAPLPPQTNPIGGSFTGQRALARALPIRSVVSSPIRALALYPAIRDRPLTIRMPHCHRPAMRGLLLPA